MDKIVRRKKRQEIALKCSLIFCHGLCEKKILQNIHAVKIIKKHKAQITLNLCSYYT
jgi:undecaprenyl pyrophosphate synthase